MRTRSSEDQTSSHRSKISDSLRRIAKRTRPGVRPVVSLPALQDIGPRQFHGRTIRHLRPAASVSGLSASPTTSSGRNGDRSSYSSSGSRPGQAITAPRVLGSPGRKASIGSQNAFLTLPPHLHHLLRVPETGDLVPSRPAPLAPRLGRIRSVPALRRESSGLAAFADAAAREEAELALALAASLDSPAARGDLDRKSLERRGVDPVAGTGQIDHLFARRPWSGLPSSRSTTGGTEGSSSSDLPVLDDVSNLFFRPPPSTPPRSAKVSSRRHVSTGSTNVSEPSSDRRSSSSASAKLHEARPRLNPVQEPWPATSFGRANLGADDIIEKSARKTSTALTPTNASRESFLQFDDDGDGGMGGGVPDRVASACSFIDFEEEASWLRGQLTNSSCDVTAEPAGAAEPAPPPRLSFGARRAEHLSIRSNLFLLAPSDSRSPGPQSDFSGQSTPLAGRIEEFPAPPSFDYYEEGATSPFGEGLLGRAVLAAFKNAGHEVKGTAFSRAGGDLVKLDLQDEAAVKSLVEELQPQVVVHCAAERRPDVVEADPAAAQKLNVAVPGFLSTLSRSPEHPFFLIYISTDYVFDGHAPPTGYEPVAATGPTNAYGESKLAGEKAVLAGFEAGGKGCVLRIPVLYGKAESNSESAINVLVDAVRKAADGNAMKMDNWAARNPTCVEDIARVLRDLAVKSQQDVAIPPILHFSAQQVFTKYEMATILAQAHSPPLDTQDNLMRVDEGPKPGETVRPKDCHLSNRAIESLGINTHTVDFTTWWQEYLRV
ncbi:hypothetical protein JCM8202v2_003063 [Rhodotorula sphaerocarpa]